MARKPRKRRLTLYLVKAGLSPVEVLRDQESVRAYDVPSLSKARLFVGGVKPHPPWWVDFLQPHLDGKLEKLFNSSTSAVLVLRAGGRSFAVTFGYGRNLLQPESYEQDFGLKVVLNTVAPDQLRSVDARTFDELTLHTRRDISRNSSLQAFGLDVTRDLVRAVTGAPRDDAIAQRLTGADALALNTHTQVPDLPSLCKRLLEAYASEDYKEHFGFVDHLRPERNPSVVDELNEALVEALRTRAIDDLHLAAPEAMDWIDIEGFRFSSDRNKEVHADPPISAYLATRSSEDLSVDRLKQDRVEAISATSGEEARHWSVYRCIVFETQQGDHLYALSVGQWYRVDLRFKDYVYAFVEKLPKLYLELPEADQGTTERAYNTKAADAAGALCLDGKLATRSVPDQVEVCDLLTPDGQLIHVKKRGSSSTLSHLFSQGVTCGELLMQDQAFREEAREIARAADPAFAEVLPAQRPTPGEYQVAYVVITRSTRRTPLTLPFFSLVSLRAAARRLQGMGYEVAAGTVWEGGPVSAGHSG